jgi:uroporphyrinogen decarboxylase
MMRQAVFTEYKRLRAQAGDFLSLKQPELAAEVTLQPIRRYGFDASILFADILLLPQALGAEPSVTGEGLCLSTVTTADELKLALKPVSAIHDTLSPDLRNHKLLTANWVRRCHAWFCRCAGLSRLA